MINDVEHLSYAYLDIVFGEISKFFFSILNQVIWFLSSNFNSILIRYLQRALQYQGQPWARYFYSPSGLTVPGAALG